MDATDRLRVRVLRELMAAGAAGRRAEDLEAACGADVCTVLAELEQVGWIMHCQGNCQCWHVTKAGHEAWYGTSLVHGVGGVLERDP